MTLSSGAVFFASGVFYYFLTEQVKALVQEMADAFPGGVLVFDAANRTAVKMIAKTWLKSAKIKDVGAYFAVSDAQKRAFPWDSRLQVTSRGYMLGYNDLKDPSVSEVADSPRCNVLTMSPELRRTLYNAALPFSFASSTILLAVVRIKFTKYSQYVPISSCHY